MWKTDKITLKSLLDQFVALWKFWKITQRNPAHFKHTKQCAHTFFLYVVHWIQDFEGSAVEQNFGTRLVYSVFFVAWKSALQSAPQDQWLPCVAKFTLWIEDSRYRLLTLQNVCIQYRSACLTSLSLWSNFMFQSINVSPFQILSDHMFKTHK